MIKIITLLLLVCSTAYAGNEGLNIVDGSLVSVTNITVEGYGQYDVEFVDGDCPTLYAPCYGQDNFTFNTIPGVKAASESLMLLFDELDDDGFQPGKTPALVNGCEETSCAIMTPAYTLTGEVETVVGVYINRGSVRGGDDFVYVDTQVTAYDVTDEEWATYARWSLIPVVEEDCCVASCHP
jgi:hypothetical protein